MNRPRLATTPGTSPAAARLAEITVGARPAPDAAPVEPRFTVAWKHYDCAQEWEFESSETYTRSAAEARRAALAEGHSYDIEFVPA